MISHRLLLALLACALSTGCGPAFSRSEIPSGIEGRVTRIASGGASTGVDGALCVLEPTDKVVTTANDGAFAFDDLAPGPYFVLCRYSDGGEAMALLAPATLAEGEVLKLGDLRLEATATLTGTAQLMDATEHAGVSVFVPGTTLEAKTGADGSFAFNDMPAARLGLRFERAGYLPMTIDEVALEPGALVHLDVVLLAINTGVTGSILLADGAAVVTSREVEVRVVASPGAWEMLVSEDSSFADALRQKVTEPLTWTFTGEGEVRLYVKFLNIDGVDGSVASDTVIIDTEPPMGSVSIEPDGVAINTRDVTLALAATDTTSVAEVLIANDPSFSGVTWTPFNATLPWTLSPGDGIKNVYVRFRDAQGLASDVVYDAVELDTQAPPPGVITFPSGTVISGNAIEVELAGPAATWMLLSDGSPLFAPTVPLPYTRRFVWTFSPGADGPRTLYLALIDDAGNVSAQSSAQVEIDNTPPTDPEPVSNGPVSYTNTGVYIVQLSSPSTDTNFAGYQLMAGPNTNYSVWAPAPDPSDLRVQLFAEGRFVVGVRGVDTAGNTSGAAWITVESDFTPPQVQYGSSFVSTTLDPPYVNVLEFSAVSNEPGTSCELQYTHNAISQTVPVNPVVTLALPEQTRVDYQLTCTDLAGNATVRIFSEGSGTAVSTGRVPASPWGVSGSPYWILGTVIMGNGNLTLAPGVKVRAAGASAALEGLISFTADSGGGSAIVIDNVTFDVVNLTLNGAQVTGGSSSASNSVSLTNCTFTDHDLSPSVVSSNTVIERNVFVDAKLTVMPLTAVALELRNNLLTGSANLRVTWSDAALVSVSDNSFLSPGYPMVQLAGPATTGPGAADLNISGNYWNTQNLNIMDPMISLTAAGVPYSGLDLVDTSGGLPTSGHPDTPSL